jgi:SAM-dependent methyltransferase
MKQKLKSYIRRTQLYHALGPYLMHARGKLFDLRHGVNTSGGVKAVDLRKYSVSGSNADLGNGYMGVDPKLFTRLFRDLDIKYEDKVFIDFGSGMGRALLLASEYPFKKVIGVEFVAELHQTAEQNICRYKSSSQKCKDIESVCMDAIDYPIPPYPTVFFIFNSFKGEVLSPVLANISKSLEKNPREAFIAYFNPEVDYLFESNKALSKVLSNEWYSIYKNAPPSR